MELAFLPNSKNDYDKKGYNYSLKKKIPLTLLLNLFGMLIVAQILQNIKVLCEKKRIYYSVCKARICPL